MKNSYKIAVGLGLFAGLVLFFNNCDGFKATAPELANSSSNITGPTNNNSGLAQLGLNIDFNEQALNDLIQPTSSLSAISGTLTGDSMGWPQQDFLFQIDNRYLFEWDGSGAVNVDPMHFSTDLSGAYSLIFTGQATVTPLDGVSVSNQVYDSATNTTTATINIPSVAGGAFFQIQFTNTKRLPTDAAGVGLTNVHLYRPGYNPASPSTFTAAWMDTLKNNAWSAMRFMGTMGTNSYTEAYPTLLNWSTDRPVVGAGPLYSATHIGNHGLPWEYVIQAANTANHDIWINVPHNASSAYVAAMASLFAQGLNSNLNVYLEYSNEMWHLGFPQGPWNATAAQSEVAAGGSNLNYDNVNNLDLWRFRRQAKRTVEIGEAFKTAFGSGAARIRPVINNGFPAFNTDMLNYVTKNYGPPAQYLYGMAINGYYTTSDFSSIGAIEQGEINNSNSHNLPLYIQNRTIATFYGLHSLVYEGGPGETGNPQANTPMDSTLPNKFAANRDAGMQQVLTNDVLNNFFPSGGDLYMHFTQVGRYGVFGFWGLTEDITNLSTTPSGSANGKWKAAMQILSTKTPAISKLNALPVDVGSSISVKETSPPSQEFAIEPQTPSALPNLQPWLEIPLIAEVAGSYSIQLQGLQPSSGNVTVWVDNTEIGTALFGSAQINGIDPRSNTLNISLTPGLHSVFVYSPVTTLYAAQMNAQASDTAIFVRTQ